LLPKRNAKRNYDHVSKTLEKTSIYTLTQKNGIFFATFWIQQKCPISGKVFLKLQIT